ncbi:MAG: c-type cytochrome [Azoarcus sp.]|nr:c-type cytochrome [Azoarcus sp.]
MKTSVAIAVAVGFLFSSSAFAAGEEDLAKAKNCMTCHKVADKLIGPSYKEVAVKYAGQKGAADLLVEKVIKGGVGVWGQVPMTPNPGVTPDEAKKLVAWILATK